ncbi:MAG TPA: helix-hairpin-helix domain-containing protein [Nonomuraea sp.]|nr:helix-hairpin-helix domain-containing protein [Nonomuraea sp.]
MEADDFTRIDGIGHKIESRLRAAGVYTYKDLADRSADELAELLTGMSGLSRERIESWRSQAAALTGVAGMAVSRPPDEGQHDESYLVRVLVNDHDGSIRSTTMSRIATDEEGRWPGWDADRMLDFVQGRAGTGRHGYLAAEVGGEEQAQEEAAARPIDIVVDGLLVERRPVRAAQPFSVIMTVRASHDERLAYDATLVAKPVDGTAKQLVATETGVLPPGVPEVRIVAQAPVTPGRYRLDAAISLRGWGETRPRGVAAMVENLFIDVQPA